MEVWRREEKLQEDYFYLAQFMDEGGSRNNDGVRRQGVALTKPARPPVNHATVDLLGVAQSPVLTFTLTIMMLK